MPYFVYILKSRTADKYYTGTSQNPEIRLEHHNTIEKGFTIRYRPLEFVYVEKYKTRVEVLKREKQSKSKKSVDLLGNFLRIN